MDDKPNPGARPEAAALRVVHHDGGLGDVGLIWWWRQYQPD